MHATLTLVDSNLLLLLLSLGGEEIWNLRKPKKKILSEDIYLTLSAFTLDKKHKARCT
jgi:hypothetical protein